MFNELFMDIYWLCDSDAERLLTMPASEENGTIDIARIIWVKDLVTHRQYAIDVATSAVQRARAATASTAAAAAAAAAAADVNDAGNSDNDADEWAVDAAAAAAVETDTLECIGTLSTPPLALPLPSMSAAAAAAAASIGTTSGHSNNSQLALTAGVRDLR
jgi:hypothetical protein